MLFTAGNLMPVPGDLPAAVPDLQAGPAARFLSDTDTGYLLGTKLAVILIHVAFQVGFCTFVLSNYMKTIPKELSEAAASTAPALPRQFFR